MSAVADVSDRPETRTAALWRAFEAANATAKAKAQCRLEALRLVEQFEAVGLTRSAAVAGSSAQSGVGSSTLWSWLALVEGVASADWLPFLLPRQGGGGDEADVHPEAWRLLLSDYLRPEQPPFSSCFRRLTDWATENGVALPHERSLRRKLEREVDGRLVIARRKGAEALRRTLPAQQRSVAELHALEAVNIDGHRFDVFVRWPDGRIGRPCMIAVQDLYSRKFVGKRIGESESALLTRLAFADVFREHGIFKHCVLDNGRAFASKWISGGAKTRFRFKVKDDEPLGLLTLLGVQLHWTFPFRGQSKPIERGFRDLASDISRHPALAGAYTGNKPDAKPENYGDRAVPIADFVALVEKEMARHNARLGRRTETAFGRSFDQTFEQSYVAAPIGRATPEQLRLALLTGEEVGTDRKTGTVTLAGTRYWAPELHDVAGKRVIIRFDPEDLTQPIHVYDRLGTFIATAPPIEAVGFFDMDAAKRRARQEADLRRLVREHERQADLLSAGDVAALLPELANDDARPSPSVIRPVRARGQTAAALRAVAKPVSESREEPLNPVIDRLGAALRLVG